MPDKNIQEWKVEGMTCTNCARTVSKFLERKGMESVLVNFTTDEVRFENVNGTPLPDLVGGIEKLGFTVADDGSHIQARKPAFWTLERKFLLSLVFTLPLFLGHLLMMVGLHIPFLENANVQLLLCIPVYVVGFLHFGQSAYHALRMGNTNMDVLIFMGSTAAFVYSVLGWHWGNPNYIFFETAATIITLVLLGNLMEKRAVDRTTLAIDQLAKLQSPEALRISPDGSTARIPTAEIRLGDRLRVNEGDAIPTDGRALSGNGWADESMLTGESQPVEKSKGDGLTGASVLISGQLDMEATAIGKDTVLSQIIALVKNAQSEPPHIQRLADRISAVFVPVVVGIALLTVLLGWGAFGLPFSQALMNAIAVLVISCPCAMGLATPAAIMVGLGRAAQSGVLVKGSRTLEILAQIKYIVLDKTGTLTDGHFQVEAMDTRTGDEAEIQAAVKGLETYSSHPIAKSLAIAWPDVAALAFSGVGEDKGLKVYGTDAQGRKWEVGSSRIVDGDSDMDTSNADVFVLCDGQWVASIRLKDHFKEHVEDLGPYFKAQGVETWLLSGDKETKVAQAAQKTGIAHYEARKLPQEKHQIIRDLSQRGKVAMVGDGINDAAALAVADVGVSLGHASDVAIHAADVVLLNGQPQKLVEAHQISRHTLLTIRQNLFWAFSYNIIAIPLAALGFLSPMWGALFMAFSDVVVIGNSLRLRWKRLNGVSAQ